MKHMVFFVWHELCHRRLSNCLNGQFAAEAGLVKCKCVFGISMKAQVCMDECHRPPPFKMSDAFSTREEYTTNQKPVRITSFTVGGGNSCRQASEKGVSSAIKNTRRRE